MSVPEFAGFHLVRRGYDRREVDRYLDALADRAAPAGAPPAFGVRWRGYDRAEVDARVAELLAARGGGD